MKNLKEFILNESVLDEAGKPNNREKKLKKNAIRFAKNYWPTVAQSTYDEYENEFDDRLNNIYENTIIMKELIKELNKKFK